MKWKIQRNNRPPSPRLQDATTDANVRSGGAVRPFAALTGYDAAIKETGRLTDERIELDEEALTALDMKYQLLMDALDDKPEVTITYFQPDERKAGGKYVSAVGTVKKVDDFERRITMQDGSKIPMDDVLIIDGEIFSSLE